MPWLERVGFTAASFNVIYIDLCYCYCLSIRLHKLNAIMISQITNWIHSLQYLIFKRFQESMYSNFLQAGVTGYRMHLNTFLVIKWYLTLFLRYVQFEIYISMYFSNWRRPKAWAQDLGMSEVEWTISRVHAESWTRSPRVFIDTDHSNCLVYVCNDYLEELLE